VGEVLDGALDQLRAVVDRHDLHALRQAALQLGELGLDAAIVSSAFLPERRIDHAAGDFALAVQFGDAAPHLGADLHALRRRPDARHATGVAVFSGITRKSSSVFR
jgi:hypothetical protein